MLIIEYYQVVRYPSYGSGTWQVILFDNHNILFQYKDIDLGNLYTIGIQGSATTGLQYSYHTAVSNELAVCFTYPGQMVCGSDSFVPWLTETPLSGTLTPSTTQVISVTFDASVPEVTQPGHYSASLAVGDDSPYVLPALPVVMTVQTNPNWGKVIGTVTGLGHCDAPGAALEEATVLLESGSGQRWRVNTDDKGAYSLWLDQSYSPLIATVDYDGYISQTMANITVTQQVTSTQNFNLQLDAPCLTVTSADFDITLIQGMSDTLPLTLTNTGAGDTNFWLNIHEQPDDVPPGNGVDYTFADSNDFNGPTYHWIEIAPPAGGNGTEITALSGSDDDYDTLILPFDFPFYGTNYTLVDVSTNGLLYFSDDWDGEDYDYDDLPTTWYETFVAPFWEDLYIVPEAIYYQDLGSMFVIEYYNISYCCSSSGSITWQVILFANGDILFQYKEYFSGGGATIGIQGNKSTALQYNDHPSTLTDGLAVCFSSNICPYVDAAWLSTEPLTGTVATANTQPVDVLFDTSVVTQSGEYSATLIVISNDPANPIINISVTMTVVSYNLTLQPAANTQSGTPGSTLTHTLSLTNSGDFSDTFDLTLTDHTWPTTGSTIVGPLAANTGVNLQITVTIPSTATGSSQDTATLTVTSQTDPTKSATATLTTDLLTYTLTVNTAGNGAGNVTLDPSGGIYDYGAVVTLTATSNTASTFEGWSGAVISNTQTITLTMTKHQSITATFNLINDTIPPTFTLNALITPTNGVLLAITRPAFDWEDATDNLSGVVSYTLLITSSNNNNIALQEIATITTSPSNFTPTADLDNGTYTWTVRAHDAAGNISNYVTPPTTFTLSAASSTSIYLPIVVKNN